MTEPNLGSTVAAAGTVTLFLTEVLGIDAMSLAWGFAGGLVGQIGNEYTNKWRAFCMVIAGALTAGAMSTLMVHWIHSYSPALPLIPLKVLVAFTIGVTWNSIVKGFRTAIPTAINEALLRFVRPAAPRPPPRRQVPPDTDTRPPARHDDDFDHRPPGA